MMESLRGLVLWISVGLLLVGWPVAGGMGLLLWFVLWLLSPLELTLWWRERPPK